MSLIQESYVQSLLVECDQLSQKQERQAREAIVKNLDKIYKIFKDNVKEAFSKYSPDVLVRFTEIAVENPARFDQATDILQLLFERFSSSNQFYIRALLVKSKVVAYTAHRNSQKGEEMLTSLKQSIAFISKALDLIAPQQEGAAKGKDPKAQGGDTSNKTRYAFLIYNASTTLYKVTRFMLRPGWQKSFADIYERVYKLLEEVDEPDHNWRSRFTMVLYHCLYDAQKKPDAFKILDTLWDKTKNKPCDFQDSLFRLRCYLCKENNAMAANIKKDIEGADPNGWKILQPLQRMRSGLIPEAQIEKELMAIVNQISLGVLSNNESNSHTQISVVMQQRLAEAGRVALRFNLIGLASSIVSYLGKTRQPNQRALILNEYNKAQLLIKKKGQYVDKNTGMSMSMVQIRQAEIQNRKQALKVMQKVMLINKKLNNAELIYEGAIIVWNIALPFLCPQYHKFAARALDLSLSLIQQIDSNDHELRIKLHIQLISIYLGNDLMFSEVESNVFKALRLDPSIPITKVPNKPQQEQDPSLYTRPYHRYLAQFRQKVLLKTMQIVEPTPLDMVTQDLWTIQDQKSQTTKIDMLQKCLKILLSYEQPPFLIKQQEMLVQEEIKQRKLEYNRAKLRSLKRSKLLAAQIAKLSFEWDLNDFAKKACEFVLSDAWDVKNSIQLIIAQGHCSLFMSQILVDQIYQLGCQPLFDEEEVSLKQEQKKTVKDKRGELIGYLKKTLQFAQTTQQGYLTFNGAICIWNNFLHLFRVNANDSKLRSDVVDILKQYFEAMRNILKEVETKATIYYDLDIKIQAFSNVGLVYARILEGQKQTASVEKVCQDLLLTNLSPNTRKLINGIKARVSGGKAPTGGKPADPKKGAPPVQKTAGFNDTFILEIDNQLQLIQNAPNKAELQSQIIKCFQALDNWKPNEQDQSELELHAELWVKLARLASEQENSKMLKYALRCSEKALAQFKSSSSASIPPNRLRWYSLADFLSSGTLLKLVNSKTQESSSVEVLLFLSLNRAVEAASKGFKCGINILVVDAGKQLWNVCSHLQQSKNNRQKLQKPIAQVLGYLKELKEDSQPDLLLLLSQLFFKIAWENQHYKTGEAVTDLMFDLLPKNLQRSVWEAKMGFMSKQGKNQLQAISSIKEAQPSLQAKLWVKLARIAPNPIKQQTAYKKALEILKKEGSVEIVQILIEYSEWQLRVGKEPLDLVIKNLQYASNLLIAIEEGNTLDQQDQQNDQMTLGSHSRRSRSHNSKKSGASKTMKSSQRQATKDKKVTVSSKSKASRVSRMTRSGRGQKAVNNKNAKSVFSQREEDPNPEFLNCIHYERLFRIYTILASICKEGSVKVSYALNACRQVQSMLKKSISTFNQLQENAAKLNEKDEKVKLKIEKIPELIEEWVSYEFPKEYLDKIEKIENTSFLGASTIEKPELTYSYLLKLMKLMCSIGLDYETIPLSFFSKYLTKHILKNESYWCLQQLKLKRILVRSHHSKEETIIINFKQFTIPEDQVKLQTLKAEYQRSNTAQHSNSFDHQISPNLIKPLSKYNYWFEVAQVLMDFGQVATAKNHLLQALKCAKILNAIDIIGKIYLLLCQIAYLEGEQQQAMKYLSMAHRLCKSIPDWQKIVDLASKILIGLKKYDQLRTFLMKVISTTSELINENQRQGKDVINFKSEISDLVQLSLAVEVSNVFLSFRVTQEQNTKEHKQSFTTSLNNLERTIRENDKIMWNTLNYENIITKFKQIIEVFESRGGKQLVNLDFRNFKKILSIEGFLYNGNKELSKNKSIKQMEGGFYNHLIEVQTTLGFMLTNCLCIHHQLSQIITISSDLEDQPQNNEILKSFLQTVNKEVEQHAMPAETELSPLEEALTILNDIEVHLQQSSVHYPQLIAMQVYVNVLKDPQSEESLDTTETFKGQFEERLNKFQEDGSCFEFQSKVYQALSLLTVEGQEAEFFEYLNKFQQSSSIQSVFTFLKRKLKPTHKFLSALKIIDRNSNKMFREKLIQRQKLFGCIFRHQSYQEGLKFVPKNSLFITIQLNKTKTKMMVGVMESESDPNNKKFKAKAKNISEKELKNYKQLIDFYLQHKKKLTKTSFEDVSKIEAVVAESETKLRQTKNMLQSLNGWWLKEVIDSLKKPKEAPVPTNQKDKKGAKDQKKKGGKDEVGAYQSPLPPAPSGIESVTFLLDQFLYSLPFEEMIPAELVASVSKDSSFFWNTRKLQEIGFQSELNNSNGIGADKGKYFSYDFKSQQYNFKEIGGELMKGADSIKFQGTQSTLKIPSLGDYSDAFLKPGFLQLYGNIDIINHVRFNTFMEYGGRSKLKLLVVHDALNYPKHMLNKHKDIVQDYPSVLLQEAEDALAVIANLLNLTVIKNRWICPPDQMLVRIKQGYQSLAKGHYIGSVLRQNRKETDKINDILLGYIHGPAVIRL